ncbi:hypothetical protein HF086_006540, partial [Spodoptera exigua]
MSLKKAGAGGAAGAGEGRAVQMRRPTNRRGKQAPTPPKRTSLLSSCSSFRESQYAADDAAPEDPPAPLNGGGGGAGGARGREASSEGSLAEGTPDTDESGGEPRHRNKRRHHAHHAQHAAPPDQPHHKPRQAAAPAGRAGFPPPPADLPPPPEDPQPPPPPPPPDCCRDAGTDTGDRGLDALPLPPPLAHDRDDDKLAKKNMKEMLELKLVAEIKERADKKKHRQKDSPPPDELVDMHTSFGDPVTRLVSELSESLNMDALRRKPETATAAARHHDDAKETVSPIDLKASLRKTAYNNSVDQKSTEIKNSTDFKAQLKKVETNKKNLATSKDVEESGRAIIDFKSRLRKVESSTPATNGTSKKPERSPEEQRDEERKRTESGSLETSGGDDDDKRRSTGSISSLKKLWESKETDERLSPKARSRPDEPDASPEERGAGVARAGSVARRRDDKPAVPCKPPVKGKPAKQGIYATPLQPAPDDADDADLLAALRNTLDWCTNEVRRGGGRGSLWRLQTSERVARLGGAVAAAGDARRCSPALRLQLRAAAARLDAEARARLPRAPQPPPRRRRRARAQGPRRHRAQ